MTRKLISIISILLFAIACINQVPGDYKEHKILLKNNLGVVSISLPQEFDTAYSWTNNSDANCCEYEMYRIANRKYSLLHESGFIYPDTPDSLYQLTIRQSKYLECDDTAFRINDKILAQIVENYKYAHPEETILTKKSRVINNRTFAYIVTQSNVNGIYSSTILLYTEIKGHPIDLKFSYQAKTPMNFPDKMKKSINSISLSDAQ